MDVCLAAAFLGHLFLGKAIVHFPPVKNVAERVKMGVGQTVVGDTIGVHVCPGLTDTGANHGVLVRPGIVDGLFCLRIPRQGNRYSLRHQGSRLLPLGGGNKVDRSQLVLLAPATPVGEFPHPPIQVFLGHLLPCLRLRLEGESSGKRCTQRYPHCDDQENKSSVERSHGNPPQADCE